MDASQSSLKLWGSILDERPTAIPSTPCASSKGNLTGRVTGSLFAVRHRKVSIRKIKEPPSLPAIATYAAGFRAPGVDELYYSMFKKMGSKYTISIGDADLKPEHSNYYSVNMEYRTNRFSASVTGYLNYLTDMCLPK